MITKGVFLLGAGALPLGFATATATAAEVFTLKSTTFTDGKMMPKKLANTKQNGNNNIAYGIPPSVTALPKAK